MSQSLPDSHSDSNQSKAPLVSTLASDPDMLELVQFFVDEIGDRVNTIQATSSANDLIGLRTVAHQLKGAGAGYGFEPISDTAGELERLIDVTEAQAVTEAIRGQVDELIDLCRRASI